MYPNNVCIHITCYNICLLFVCSMQQPRLRRGRSAAVGSTQFWAGEATNVRDASTQTEMLPFVAPPSHGPMPQLITLRGRAPEGHVTVMVRTSVVAGQEEMVIVSREVVTPLESQRRMTETQRRAARMETQRGPETQQRALRGRPSATVTDPLLLRPDDHLFEVGGPEDSQWSPM